MAVEPDHLEFDAVTTLDDYVAMYLYAMRRPRRLVNLAIITVLAFVWYTAAIMVQNLFNKVDGLAALGDPEVLQNYADTSGWSDLMSTMTDVGAWVGGVFLLTVVVLLPLQARAHARRILRERPDIDASDRKLTQRNHCRLDAGGYSWSVPDTHSAFAWSHFTHLAETRRHLFMMISPSAGVVFPKQAMDRALLDAVRGFAGRHIGQPGTVPA